MAGTCEVALALPLRNTFSYAIPDALEQRVVPGARVVVPFRNRSMIGVALEVRAPEGRDAAAPASSKTAARSYAQPLKTVADVLDAQPALSPQLITLGRWV